jgi:hypothetical protein
MGSTTVHTSAATLNIAVRKGWIQALAIGSAALLPLMQRSVDRHLERTGKAPDMVYGT